MTARRAVLLLHRWAGLAVSAFLLVAGITGCLLVFRPELDALSNPELFAAPHGAVLDGAELARRLSAAHPDWVLRSVPVRAEPGVSLDVELRPIDVSVRGRTVRGADEVFLDPRDGTVTGARNRALRPDRAHLFQVLLALHYTLLAGGPGRWLMGAAAGFWLILNVLGLVITWPRRSPKLRHWAPSWMASRSGLRMRPLVELHRVAGLWLIAVLCVLAYTSFAFNFYEELFVPAVEALSPPRPNDPFDAPPPAAPPAGPVIGFANALRIAERAAAVQAPGLAAATIGEDREHDLYEIGFSPGGTRRFERAGPVSFLVGRHDGRLVWVDRPRLDGWGRVLERTLYPLHTGQVAGLPTRILALLGGLATVGLVVTGFIPWWRRRRMRWRNRARATAGQDRPVRRPARVDTAGTG